MAISVSGKHPSRLPSYRLSRQKRGKNPRTGPTFCLFSPTLDRGVLNEYVVLVSIVFEVIERANDRESLVERRGYTERDSALIGCFCGIIRGTLVERGNRNRRIDVKN